MTARVLLDAYIADHGRWLFHLTDAVNVENILREGLRPSGSDSEYERELVRAEYAYLCNANVARATLNGYLADWGDAAIAVDLSRLDPTRLAGDEDYWRGELMSAGVRDTSSRNVLRLRPDIDKPVVLFASLRDGGTCCHYGVIAPAALQIAHLPRRPDLPGLSLLRVRVSAEAAAALDYDGE